MKILLSPAKSLNEKVAILNGSYSQPCLLNFSEELMDDLKKMQPLIMKMVVMLADIF